MPKGAKIGHRKGGGRTKGTPNKRSLALRQALESRGCHLEQQIAGLLQDPEVDVALKVDLIRIVLPRTFPELRPVDPDNFLSPEQMAGALGAQAARFREALHRHMPDPIVRAQVLDELRPQTPNANGASAPAV
jgi:hypothetical protein